MNSISARNPASPHTVCSALLTADLQRRLELYARRRLGDHASVQDVVQTTMEALLRAKVAFRGESSYQTYAIGILRHKIGDALNERKRYVSLAESGTQDKEMDVPAPYDMGRDAFTGPEQHAHSIALARAIQRGLETLSPRSRQTFLLRERLELEGEDIAAQMGLSISNTWVLLCRAKRQLRISLQGQGYGPLNTRVQHV
jgi:RNA polymerase sigma-70 factor (ECF subfamily)